MHYSDVKYGYMDVVSRDVESTGQKVLNKLFSPPF